MLSSRTAQIVLITGGVALTAALYFAPHKPSTLPAAKEVMPPKQSVFDFDVLLAFQKKNLSADELQKTEGWMADLKQASSRININLYDSLALVWDSKKMYSLSAHYYELKAEKDKSEKSYLNAAYRYFDAYKEAIDSSLKASLAREAIKNYEQVTMINPNNLDAKTDLGALYAEATAEPMKGIMLLREVVTTDPKHENAQMNLGFLSVKSRQYEKALERFDRVLEINPKRIDALLYKGQVYAEMGNKEKAIETFENYKKLSADKEINAQVTQYIEELKKQ